MSLSTRAGGDRAVHELVEPGGVQVGRHGDGSALVGDVDEPVEAFGGVGADREKPDVIDDDEVGADDGPERFGDGVVES